MYVLLCSQVLNAPLIYGGVLVSMGISHYILRNFMRGLEAEVSIRSLLKSNSTQLDEIN